MIRICLLLLAGGLAAQHSRVPISSDLCNMAFVASAVFILGRRTRPGGWLVLGYALFMQAGLDIVAERLDPAYAGDSMLARVRVAEFPVIRDRVVSLIVEPVDDRRLPRRARVTWFDPPVHPRLGEVWALELRLRRPRGGSNPGGFDVETWLFREKLLASGYVVNGRRNTLLWSGTAGPVERVRADFVARARAAADTDAAAGVLAALGTGARHLLSRQQWHSYAATGTSHLMAISGLHVGLAAGVAYLVGFATLGALAGRRNHHLLAILGGLLAAAAYAVVAGFGVPARRAVLMLAIVALALLRRRRPDPGAVVALAAIVIYATDPVASLSPGFQLSFGAVLLLVWLARRRGGDVPRHRVARVVAYLRQLVVMQVFLFLGLLPLGVISFDRVASYAVPVNLVAVPVFTFLTVPLTLGGLVTGLVSDSVSDAALRLAATSIDLVERLVTLAASLPKAGATTAALSAPALACLLLVALWAVLPRGWPGRGIALLALLAVVTFRPAAPPRACLDAWILDVGQGLAAVVQTERHALLYDTGMAWRGGGSAADQVIVPFLKSRGLRRVDWLMVSHGDLDHAGGIRSLLEYGGFADILVGEPLAQIPDHSRPCTAGEGWQVDGVRFDILGPDGSFEHDGNDASCVLRVAAGNYALLLTGDVEAAAERRLIRDHAALGATVIVVPHHGSRTSSSLPFVDSVRPAIAIVSAGFDNRWGFPKPEVVSRWQRVGAEVIESARAGAVGVRLCAVGGLMRVTRERESHRRFWHEP